MTQHVSEEELILHYYGESGGAAGVEGHLAVCHGCREQYTRLQQVLNVVEMPVPDRGSDYEERVWNRLSPKLGVRQRLAWWAPRKWAAIAAMCALVAVAFVAGRYSPPLEKVKVAAPPVRERVLVVAVGNHLERSKMVLVELKNLPDTKKVDIGDEQSFARDLLSENRLYRQTAATAGETGLVGVLEDLERVLMEVVHSPSTIDSADLDDIRQRIESQGLLFKMRVVESNLNVRAQESAAPNGKQL